MMSDFTVELKDDRTGEFNVVFHGPKESPYEGGVWKLYVKLPDTYPYEPPENAFLNKIFHPNIDERHSDSKSAMKRNRSFRDGDISDVYPLHLRLSVLRETNSLGVKISKKDNAAELFRRACKIFNIETELLHMWDFLGRTNQLFMNDKATTAKDV